MEEISMRSSRSAISVLMIASLFAAITMAPAQAQRGPGMPHKETTEAQGTTEAQAAQPNKTPGLTTGAASTAKPHTHKGVLPNSSMQNAQDSGTGRGK
jgi:hypothetical protein